MAMAAMLNYQRVALVSPDVDDRSSTPVAGSLADGPNGQGSNYRWAIKHGIGPPRESNRDSKLWNR